MTRAPSSLFGRRGPRLRLGSVGVLHSHHINDFTRAQRGGLALRGLPPQCDALHTPPSTRPPARASRLSLTFDLPLTRTTSPPTPYSPTPYPKPANPHPRSQSSRIHIPDPNSVAPTSLIQTQSHPRPLMYILGATRRGILMAHMNTALVGTNIKV